MNIREQIQTTIKELVSLEAVKRHFDEIVEQEEELIKQCDVQERLVDKELSDLEKLEGMSVQKMYHKVMGSVDEKKSKEREEYMEAMLNLKEMQQSLELIVFEKEVLQKKIVDIKLLQERLGLLKKQREEEILRGNSEFRSALLDIENQRDSAWAFKNEIEEVLQVGDELDKALRFILDRFKHSQYWSSVNTNSMRSNREIEHSLQQAFKALSQARILHKRFNKELEDVNHRHADLNLSINVNELFPYFFRNFITDIMYQNKLQSAMHLVGSNINLVQAIKSAMNKSLKEQDHVLEELAQTKDTLLTR